MKLCGSCRRHVRPAAAACPFCGESSPTTGAARIGAVVLLGALEAACALRPYTESAGDGESSTSAGTGTGADGTAAPTNSGTTTTTSGVSSGVMSSSSAGELTTANDVDGSDSGCVFYGGCPLDGAVDTKECDQWLQDCPVGEKCVPYSGDGDSVWESLKCVMVDADPDAVGEPCTVEGSGVSGIDSCDKGAYCWDVDGETLQGECVAQCTGTADMPECPSPTTACDVSNDGVLSLCLPTCNPLLQDCEDGQLCLPNFLGPDFLCFLDASGDEGQVFDPCEYANVCDTGLICLQPALAVECDPMVQGCCLPFCDTALMECTGMNQECVPWFEDGMAPPGLEDVGVCAIPG